MVWSSLNNLCPHLRIILALHWIPYVQRQNYHPLIVKIIHDKMIYWYKFWNMVPLALNASQPLNSLNWSKKLKLPAILFFFFTKTDIFIQIKINNANAKSIVFEYGFLHKYLILMCYVFILYFFLLFTPAATFIKFICTSNFKVHFI